MRLTYPVLASLALVWVGVMTSSKGDPSNSPCHSSIFLPLDPLIAVESSARSVKSNPLSSEAHRELGSAYLSLFDSSEAAQQEFREVVRLDPSSSSGYTGLGWSYLDLNSLAMSFRTLGRHNSDSEIERYRVALSWFERALGLDPDDASAHLGRAQAYSLLGRNEDAEAACRAALASCPNSGEAWDLLGDVLVRLGRYNEAIDAYKAEIEISTNGTTLKSLSPLNNMGRFDVVILYRLVGNLLFTLNRTKEAIVHYEKGLAISEDSPLHHHLALAYYQIGEYERYESHLEALRVGCSSKGNDGDWCRSYEDLIYRLSEYRTNPDMLFRVTNLDAIPPVR
jgi:tetratricopeptide (TPR) repeat protein